MALIIFIALAFMVVLRVVAPIYLALVAIAGILYICYIIYYLFRHPDEALLVGLIVLVIVVISGILVFVDSDTFRNWKNKRTTVYVYETEEDFEWKRSIDRTPTSVSKGTVILMEEGSDHTSVEIIYQDRSMRSDFHDGRSRMNLANRYPLELKMTTTKDVIISLEKADSLWKIQDFEDFKRRLSALDSQS